MENVFYGVCDNWFCFVDVCVVFDGLLFVMDWYDFGVGGYNMGDLEWGRLFCVVFFNMLYDIFEFDFEIIEGCVEVL